LSTGQRRLVELARALAGDYRFLLLDEPSSGLDVGETEQFAAILSGVVEREGIGILLVEHDMALVRAVCSYIYVLDFGRLIYEGTAADVLSAEIVKAAYLGSEAAEVEVWMLELRGITAGYGSHTVLRDVNLVVPDNAVVALLGPNG